MFKFLLPKEVSFYELFNKAAEKISEGASAIKSLFDDFQDLDKKAKIIKEIEHQSDKITHETVEKLNTTFITPFDREDIYSLITKMDDILDYMEAASQRIYLYKLSKPKETAIKLVDVLIRSTDEIKKAISNLKM